MNNKKYSIPARYKTTSRYIKNIDEYDIVFRNDIISRLELTKEFWKKAKKDSSLIIPEHILGDSDDVDSLKLRLQQENIECIKIAKKRIGPRKYNKYLDPNSDISIEIKQTVKKREKEVRERKHFKETGYYTPTGLFIGKSFKYLILGLFIWYISWVMFGEKEECITITYQNFDKNYKVVEKRGRVCGDARHKVHDRWKDD